WLPIYDYPNDKTTFEIFITIDRKYETLSNGYLDYSKKIIDTEKKQDHWIMNKPNSTYLIMIAVGDFTIIKEEYRGLPVQSYVDQNINPEEANYTFRNTPEMIKAFNEFFQVDYPWNKYTQVVVEDFIYGGMENTSATVLTKRAINNFEIESDYNSDGLISHELGHQWWGDLTTCINWSEMWLNESFATYSSSLWKEKYYGNDEYDYDIYINGESALQTDTVIGRYPVWAGYGSVTANIYNKGSVQLNSFRHILGDKFLPSLKTFLSDNAFKNVSTADMIAAMDKNTGGNNKWMFDQWIWKAGFPEFEAEYEFDEKTKEVVLNIKQIQKTDTLTPVFRIPMEVRIKNIYEDKIEKIEIMDEDETFRTTFNSAPDFIVFDYGNNFLDKLHFNKPFDDWKNQLQQSEDAIDRIMSLKGLEDFLKEDTSPVAGKPAVTINQIEGLKLFEEILLNDKFWGVRAEAAKLLGRNFIINLTSEILKNSYAPQTDTRIKREILKALGNSNRSDDADFIKSKIQSEPNNYIVADGLRALTKMLPKEQIYDVAAPFAYRIAHRDVVQNAVIDALKTADTKVDDERIKSIIKDIAFGIDIDNRLRSNAITALKKYAADEDIKELLKKHADHNVSFVKRSLITMLGETKDKSLIPFLNELNSRTTDEDMSKLILRSVKKLES
ncbi:MAG: M1 family aminopeptidase, partial [Ignavibacteria bacterium]